MNRFLHGVARAVAEAFSCPGPILEIGSYQVAGQEDLINLRPLFPGRPYIGVDARPGPGVDCVADVEDLPQDDASVGTVIAMSVFEHVPRFWKGMDEVFRVLRPDGMLLLSCPFHVHIHGYPNDYWRFTPEALKVLLADYPRQVLGYHGPKRRPINVWAVAMREECPPPSERQWQLYRRRVAEYAREPMPWPRRLRYQIGRWISGSRPFLPFLEYERWETEWHSSTLPLARPLHLSVPPSTSRSA
jgi:SAM-dependent methyltransferase